MSTETQLIGSPESDFMFVPTPTRSILWFEWGSSCIGAKKKLQKSSHQARKVENDRSYHACFVGVFTHHLGNKEGQHKPNWNKGQQKIVDHPWSCNALIAIDRCETRQSTEYRDRRYEGETSNEGQKEKSDEAEVCNEPD